MIPPTNMADAVIACTMMICAAVVFIVIILKD